MTSKVLYLDFDGVMNTPKFIRSLGDSKHSFNNWRWYSEQIDPKHIGFLQEILSASNANIVVSSSWRLMNDTFACDTILRAHGLRGKIVDVTPRPFEMPNGKRSERADEIQAHLDANPHIKKFCILDDLLDMKHLSKYFVQTDMYSGLEAACVTQAVALLNQSESFFAR